jgi:hypothetical protein
MSDLFFELLGFTYSNGNYTCKYASAAPTVALVTMQINNSDILYTCNYIPCYPGLRELLTNSCVLAEVKFSKLFANWKKLAENSRIEYLQSSCPRPTVLQLLFLNLNVLQMSCLRLTVLQLSFPSSRSSCCHVLGSLFSIYHVFIIQSSNRHVLIPTIP